MWVQILLLSLKHLKLLCFVIFFQSKLQKYDFHVAWGHDKLVFYYLSGCNKLRRPRTNVTLCADMIYFLFFLFLFTVLSPLFGNCFFVYHNLLTWMSRQCLIVLLMFLKSWSNLFYQHFLSFRFSYYLFFFEHTNELTHMKVNLNSFMKI